MAKNYVGVSKNSAGTGWTYSVKKPESRGPSYYKKALKTAKTAAVAREAEIMLGNYDTSEAFNKRNFTDEEYKKVKSDSMKENWSFGKKPNK